LELTVAQVDSQSYHVRALGSWWQAVALGIGLILIGLFTLGNAAAASVVSAIIFGVALLIAGLFEVIHSIWAPHWGSVFLRLLTGALYAIAGTVLVFRSSSAAYLVPLVFAAALIASGVVRAVMALRYETKLGWLLFSSGLVGILGGIIILIKWPLSGLWVFGLVVGIDLMLHGAWWIASGWLSRREPRSA
jgi:uncharacterized membrane protein HdeD (DUF308 family)